LSDLSQVSHHLAGVKPTAGEQPGSALRTRHDRRVAARSGTKADRGQGLALIAAAVRAAAESSAGLYSRFMSDVDGSFAALARSAVDGMLERRPELATALGDHSHDARLTIGTPGITTRWPAGAQTGSPTPRPSTWTGCHRSSG
jgi:hypothetical protein